jgi:hypothetical protein
VESSIVETPLHLLVNSKLYVATIELAFRAVQQYNSTRLEASFDRLPLAKVSGETSPMVPLDNAVA